MSSHLDLEREMDSATDLEMGLVLSNLCNDRR
jgi:hypothetical protein